MDLKEFVTETLQQIHEGILNAQRSPDNPVLIANQQYDINLIQFDVALIVTENNQVKGDIQGKMGLQVAGIFSSASSETDTTNSSYSRVKFVIPIHYRKTK